MEEIAFPEQQVQYWYTYSAKRAGLNLAASADDFFQVRGGNNEWRLIGFEITQEGGTDLFMEGIRLRRGASGAGGDGQAIHKHGGISSPNASCAPASTPSTNVESVDLQHHYGWN